MNDESYYNGQIRWLTSYADHTENQEDANRLSMIVVDLKTLMARCKGLEDIIQEKFRG